MSLFILLPNLFVVVAGIESFPYTCAPMFGHYINENTSLYTLKFEGVNESGATNLIDYYGKSEVNFIRHFFSKVYGSTKTISPYSNRLSESPDLFNKRMNLFFEHYISFIDAEYNLSFDKIDLNVKQVDQHRNDITEYELIGYFDVKEKKYYSLYKN